MASNAPLRSHVLLIASLLLHFVTASSKSDSEILIPFKSTLTDNGALSSWNPSSPPCSGDKSNWVGVLCGGDKVWGLKLENLGLSGSIDFDLLKDMVDLRAVSFTGNKFEGGFPNFNMLGKLKSVYLSDNKFSGEIDPESFNGMMNLKKLHLANNQFSGQIPESLLMLSKLMELNLEGNQFTGQIPNFPQDKLKILNLAKNHLEGPIPPGLSMLNVNVFEGNEGLCGAPLAPCSTSKPPVIAIVILVVVVAFALVAIIAVFFILNGRRQENSAQESQPARGHKKTASTDLSQVEKGSPESSVSSRKGEHAVKVTFLRDDIERFDLTELLRASAEVLGSGYFGSSYKAALMSGKMMVVKRFKHMNNVGREDFQEHMRRLGRLKHANLLQVTAFYYRKEEKLLISEYVDNFSLAVHLHGNRSRGRPSPDWPTRLKIIKGVAKGLMYLYNELPSLIIPHGHLKSSNVLLTHSFEPLLCDYGLSPVVNQEHSQDILVAYKSPEYKQNNRVTKKTDVWSFGILILETLTGKFPANYLQQGKSSEADVVSWVQSIVREEMTSELFDKEMGEVKKGSEGEMLKLLQIGLACAETDVEKRCDLKEALERIEQVKEESSDQ